MDEKCFKEEVHKCCWVLIQYYYIEHRSQHYILKIPMCHQATD